MHLHSVDRWTHSHDYTTSAELSAERRTRWVVGLTLAAMATELVAGWLTGSMALLADGWHMGSHAAALGLSVFAYRFSRARAGDTRFTFGTGKVSTLAGYTSALLLGLGAIWLLWESLGRLLQPIGIRYGEAILVAGLGLVVNIASAWILGRGSADHHHADARHHHAEPDALGEHKDHNLRAAYLHVLADALTSVLAIGALAAGMLLGWAFLDPLMGVAGAVLIGRWAWSLARDSALTLLDAEDHGHLSDRIRSALEAVDDVQVADLHVWRVGASSHACIVSLVTHHPRAVEFYRASIDHIPGIGHLTVEVNQCRDAHCHPA